MVSHFPSWYQFLIKYSIYLPDRGLLRDFVDSDYLIPFVMESTEMGYSPTEMSKSLGNIQNKIRMKNLIESYIMILLIAITAVALISFANSQKFVHKKAQEIKVSSHHDAILEFVEEYNEEEEKEEIESKYSFDVSKKV